MPENMKSPENRVPMSTAQVMRGLGPSAEQLKQFEGPGQIIPQITDIQQIPGVEGQLQAAQNFPQLESRATLPDVRNQLQPMSEEQNRELEYQMRMMMSGRATQRGLDNFLRGLNEKFTIDGQIANIELKIRLAIARTPPKKEPKIDRLQEQLEFLKIKKTEIEGHPEKINASYNQVWEMGFSVMEDMFTDVVDQRRNAFPYDHRIAAQTIDMMLQTAKSFQEEEWVKGNPEAQVWFKRMERDATYLASSLQIDVTETAMLPMHWDVVQQIQILKSQYRGYITANNLEAKNYKTLPGLEFKPEEMQLAQHEIGFDIPDKYKTEYTIAQPEGTPTILERGVGIVKSNEKVGLKELATRLQSASFNARMYAAAASQVDLRLSKQDMLKSTFKKDHLDEHQLEFYRQVFWGEIKKQKPQAQWKDKDIPEYDVTYGILAPHIASVEEDKRKASSKLEAMLTTNAVERLKDLIKIGGPDLQDKITQLANEVNQAAEDRLKNWDTRGGTDIVSRLAVLVTKQGLLEDFSFMHSYRYCWQFVWKENWDGKSVLPDEKCAGTEAAGIFSWSGDQPSLYFQKRAHNYDGQANTRTNEMEPTSSGGRSELRNMAYDKMPMIFNKNPDGTYSLVNMNLEGPNGELLVDEFLQEQLRFLFSNGPKYVKMREELGYQDIQEDVAQHLMMWCVRYRTPYSTKYVEINPRDPESAKNLDNNPDVDIVVPNFFPPLDIANFYEAITTTGGKLNDGAETVWDQLIRDVPLSEIEWGKLENLQHNKWLVDLDMSSNYMHILIDFFDKEREGFYNVATGKAATSGPKELAKRIKLSFRDSAKGYPEDYEVAMIANFIVNAVANKYELSDPKSWELQPGAKTTKVEDFLAEMALWKRAFKWLASDRPGGARTYYKEESYWMADPNDPTKKIENPRMWVRADEKLRASVAAHKNKTNIDDEGYILDKPKDQGGKRIRKKWNYGNTIALMAEFFEPIVLRMGKSSAEDARMLADNNYQQTANRINKFGFMQTGNIRLQVNTKLAP